MSYMIINIIQVGGVIVGFLTLAIVAMQKASENQKVLLMASTCAFLSILSYTMEINAKTEEGMLAAAKFGYVGKCYVLLFFLSFMAAYCRVSFPKKISGFFYILNTFMLLVILTCEKHTLYYQNIRIGYDGMFPRLVFGKGICYWLFMADMLFLMLLYLIISIMELKKRKGMERKRLLLLSMAGIVPSFMLAVYLTGILDAFDPVPIGIVISCTLLTLNVVKYGLLDTMQLAKEQIIENTKEGLIVVDPNYNLLYANEIAQSLFPDIADEKECDRQIREIFGEDHGEVIIEQDGRNYEIRVSKIMGDNALGTTKGYLAWIFDMQFINRYTEEMIRLRQEAEKANLAKSSFLAHMSHEIRTPMNAILGFSDLCLRKELPEEIEEYVENIKMSAETLLHLINQILDISKIESGKMELVTLEYSARALMAEIISWRKISRQY
jgi:PAS domain-containing protein